jgi:hypothetical protein
MTTLPARAILTALVTGALLLAQPAQAGQSCDKKPLTAIGVERGMTLALRTAQALDAEYQRSGARVVILGRAGQDLSEYNLRYSHLGWAYKTDEGPWRVLHKLNQCGTTVGALYRQGLGEFFLDDLWRMEAVWSVPAKALQAPLLDWITSPVRSKQLNTREYSMVSYVWGLKYQQSNQWAIESFAAAIEPGVINRRQAHAWLQFKGYQPTTLHINAMRRLGARVGSANIAFDDHPTSKRFSDQIETVTVDSVLSWMGRTGLGGTAQRLSL